MTPRALELIQQLQMQPHPEGGFYVEVHRAAQTVQPQDARAPRSALTAIYFLLVDRGISRWHRVQSDEVWCHLEGAPLDLHRLPADEAGPRLHSVVLGPVGPSCEPQATVPAGVWQAARSQGDYSLAACFVAPGFEFVDFELMAPKDDLRAWLARQHPALAAGW
ncbi:MAG: cupin domain-containing protein [Rubrivivax sp.]|nr:cupin domain-containing protein [Rubrivivax sp.]